MKKNIPNILTFSRLIGTFGLIIIFFSPISYKFIWAYTIFLAASSTDFLDGFLARRWQAESDIGIVFDALLDKVFTLVIYLLLISFNIIPSLIFILLAIREILADGFRNYILTKNIPVKSILSGKIKFFLQILMLNFCFLALIYPDAPLFFQLAFYFGLSALFFAYLSLYFYLKIFLKFFQNSDAAKIS